MDLEKVRPVADSSEFVSILTSSNGWGSSEIVLETSDRAKGYIYDDAGLIVARNKGFFSNVDIYSPLRGLGIKRSDIADVSFWESAVELFEDHDFYNAFFISEPMPEFETVRKFSAALSASCENANADDLSGLSTKERDRLIPMFNSAGNALFRIFEPFFEQVNICEDDTYILETIAYDFEAGLYDGYLTDGKSLFKLSSC